VGPIEAKLLKFGARDETKPQAVVGFVLGSFGELSNSCYRLYTAIVKVDAARVVSFWKMPPEGALALCKQKILRFWGLTAQRGLARLIPGRFQDLVPPPPAIPRPPRASQTPLHMSTTLSSSRQWARHR
jgi:hypothetical protein